MTDDEKQLLSRCFQGDKHSWDELVQRYSNLIYHTIKKTLALHQASRASDSADDLFQDVFLFLVKDDFAQLRRFRGDHGCTLASWLRLIAARRAIDHLRRSRKTETPYEAVTPDAAIEQADTDASEDRERLLFRALAALAPRERVIIDLFFRKNLSAQEAASILRLSVTAVYTQKSRILAKLRTTLEKAG